MRCTLGGGVGRFSFGSWINWLGASSPPRVRAAPVKCDLRVSETSCWGGLALECALEDSPQFNSVNSYRIAFSRIFCLMSSGFCTARPDFSPPAKKSWFSSSSFPESRPLPEVKSPKVANFLAGARRELDCCEVYADDEREGAVSASSLESVPRRRPPLASVSCRSSSSSWSAKNSVTAASRSH